MTGASMPEHDGTGHDATGHDTAGQDATGHGASRMPAVRVSVVIPNWNGAHLLPACLDSLRRQTFRDFLVAVVDNGSTDGSRELLRTHYPEAAVIALPENVGFAAGVNAGIRGTRGEYVVLLNNDTEVAEDWLEQLVGAMDGQPQYGFGASKLLDYRQRDVIDRVADTFAPFGLPLRIGGGARDDGRFDAPFETFGACAAAAIYRRAVLDEVGLLAEDYFAYVEDVDLSMRAQLAGFRCLAVTGARVYHMGSASSGGQASSFSVRLTVRNLWCSMVRCLPLPLLATTAAQAAAVQAGAVLAALLLGRGPIGRAQLGAYFRGLGDAARALPSALRQRRSIPRRIGTRAFRRQVRLGYRQWREHRPTR